MKLFTIVEAIALACLRFTQLALIFAIVSGECLRPVDVADTRALNSGDLIFPF